MSKIDKTLVPTLLFSLFAGVFLFNANTSSAFIFESHSLFESSKIDFRGDFPGGQFGSVVGAAAVDEDGSSYMLVGAPFASVRNKQWNGAFFIIDPDTREHITSLYGKNAGDQFGTSFAVGDFNGDGIDDIAVGSFNALHNEERLGKIYLFYGGSTKTPKIFSSEQYGDFALNSADKILVGDQDEGQFGLSLLSADLNKNGYDDLIVGAPAVDGKDHKNIGAVYVFSGGEGGLKKIPDNAIYGHSPGERFGSSLATGDFYGYGTVSLAVGAYMSEGRGKPQGGKVYVYRELKDYDNYFEGYYTNSWFGFDMAAGDVNGNGINDLLVSSFPYGGDPSRAEAYLYYGGENFGAKSRPDVIIGDAGNEFLLGSSVLLNDFNGNGKDDIVIGAPSILSGSSTNNPGRVYIIFSDDSELEPYYRLKMTRGINIIYGENADDWFGYKIGSFDLNGNDIKDLAVSSIYSTNIEGVKTGKVSVFFGDNKPFGKKRMFLPSSVGTISRGELIKAVIDSFNLLEEKSGFLNNCLEHREFCLFNFMAMSSFDDIVLEPELTLYPDVPPSHPYSYYINIATLLELVNGYLQEEKSPFMPDAPVTRIQALKVILGASDLVPNKYEFELANKLGGYSFLVNQPSYFADISAKVSSMWWMPRYVNFAAKNGIIPIEDSFRPHEEISIEDLNDWISKTLSLVEQNNEET